MRIVYVLLLGGGDSMRIVLNFYGHFKLQLVYGFGYLGADRHGEHGDVLLWLGERHHLEVGVEPRGDDVLHARVSVAALLGGLERVRRGPLAGGVARH
eukprot:888068-Prorocentrum_minimum.AAC.1